MSKSDIEGYRRARNNSQLLFETVPQVLLQLRILQWSYNHPSDKIVHLQIETQLIASIASGVLHALIKSLQIYNDASAAGMDSL